MTATRHEGGESTVVSCFDRRTPTTADHASRGTCSPPSPSATVLPFRTGREPEIITARHLGHEHHGRRAAFTSLAGEQVSGLIAAIVIVGDRIGITLENFDQKTIDLDSPVTFPDGVPA